MIKQPVLETRRLLLRPLGLTHKEEIQKSAGEREIADKERILDVLMENAEVREAELRQSIRVVDAEYKQEQGQYEDVEQYVESGDVFVFHFAGHGAQKEDPDGFQESGMYETILPMDFQEAGQITDTEINGIILMHLPDATRLTVVMDCCHGGSRVQLLVGYHKRRVFLEGIFIGAGSRGCRCVLVSPPTSGNIFACFHYIIYSRKIHRQSWCTES